MTPLALVHVSLGSKLYVYLGLKLLGGGVCAPGHLKGFAKLPSLVAMAYHTAIRGGCRLPLLMLPFGQIFADF